jgi:predicted amidohydrolase
VQELLDALGEARGDLARTVAVLWTWLARHPQQLGSLHAKAPAIADAAAKVRPFTAIDEDTLCWLRKEPLHNAAVLLTRIDRQLIKRKAPLLIATSGVDGTPVIVAWREPSLAIAVHEGSKATSRPVPPATQTQPSLSAFAPGLLVSPVDVDGIKLEVLELAGTGWDAAMRRLDKGMVPPKPGLCVHLDTLGDHGMSGWSSTGQRIGCYDPGGIDAADERRCIEAAEAAVRAAAGRSTVLLMPELAATPRVLEAVRAEIAINENAPALTVVGLYHMVPEGDPQIDPALTGNSALASRVNEAVVLGPNGQELWRHRKLSCAEGKMSGSNDSTAADRSPTEDRRPTGGGLSRENDAATEELSSGEGDTAAEGALPRAGAALADDIPPGDGDTEAEDIVLGETLALAPTPMGTVAVAICIDIFDEFAHERLARSPAEVLLIPSLSPTVIRHRYSLQRLVQVLWAMGFVCNRAPYPPEGGGSVWNEDDNRSFWASQREPLEIPPKSPAGAHPSFVFKLADYPRKRARSSATGTAGSR